MYFCKVLPKSFFPAILPILKDKNAKYLAKNNSFNTTDNLSIDNSRNYYDLYVSYDAYHISLNTTLFSTHSLYDFLLFETATSAG